MAVTKGPTKTRTFKALVGEFRCVRAVSMKKYRITHSSDNLDPFWAGCHRVKQILLMPLECEEKSDEVATSCCAHLITRFNNGIQDTLGKSAYQFSKQFVVRMLKWQKWFRKAGQEVLSHG